MLSRLALNSIVRVTRTSPTIRTVVPFRWESSKSTGKQGGSSTTAFVAGAVTAVIGGLAWYKLSGTRQVVDTAPTDAKKPKDNTTDPGLTLASDSSPVLGKIFDQVEELAKEHGDDVKKIFQETYSDLQKLAKQGTLDSTQAVDIIQKHVQELQVIADTAFNKLLSENTELRNRISKSYDEFESIVQKAKEKKPEAEQLLKETTNELVDLFKTGDFSEKNVQKALDILKKKRDEAKKLAESVTKK